MQPQIMIFCNNPGILNTQALLVFTDAISHSLSIRFEAPGK